MVVLAQSVRASTCEVEGPECKSQIPPYMKYDKDLAKKLLNGKFVSTIELYQENKSAIIGENIVCPNCREVFIKKNRQHTFCDTKCKDSFWDVMVDERLNRKNIWNKR